MRGGHALVVACALAAAIAVAAPPALAEGFDARPVTIEARGGLGSVVITNPGESRIYLETVVYDWSQDAAGHDVLTESEEAVASPPAMWVGPHTTYNLRLKLPNGAPGQERAFRVMIRQLPDRNDIMAGRIVFALTQSLPAFVEPDALQPPALRGQLVGARSIIITNDGGRRARLANIRQDGHMVEPGLVGYALQHASLAIALPASLHPGPVEIDTDFGRRTLDVR